MSQHRLVVENEKRDIGTIRQISTHWSCYMYLLQVVTVHTLMQVCSLQSTRRQG